MSKPTFTKKIKARSQKNKECTILIEEKQPLTEVLQKSEVDRRKVNALVNMCFYLADVMELFIMDAEKEIKKADPDLSIELRQPIKWIKYHTKTMVRIIDTKCDEEFAEKFGDTCDKLAIHVAEFFNIKASNEL